VTDEQLLAVREDQDIRPTVADETVRLDVRKEKLAEYWQDRWYLNLTGLAIATMLIYLAGVLLGNIVGKSMYARVERVITHIPGFKQVYPHVKQVVDLVMGDSKMAFSQVVIVEYPSAGIWTVGFLTGNSLRVIDSAAGATVVSVFIPTSPTPFTGFTINLPKEKVIEIGMSVEEALRFVVTAGVLAPGVIPEKLGEGAVEKPSGDDAQA